MYSVRRKELLNSLKESSVTGGIEIISSNF